MSRSSKNLQAKAQQLAKNVLQAYNKLNEILENNEGTIQKRWACTTKVAREKILQAAWNAIPTSHRPDLQHSRKRLQYWHVYELGFFWRELRRPREALKRSPPSTRASPRVTYTHTRLGGFKSAPVETLVI